ncbi:hypothetical protein CBR_g36992 [Chara braunii]|uniref:Uncharacterized protein n=1 Tax=Chara braunii TaxID=69332 RepID=A0A388JZU9_CHABU|nr:hypothetical protein CBR_g36992 [Chara braunii]|eukprot:GBG63223.1 hypothetical protein CBR_g36992 [Chara braunii]
MISYVPRRDAADHYAWNCWAGGNGRPPAQQHPNVMAAAVDDETKEMREYFREKIRKRKLEEERKGREKEDKRRREEKNRREQERMREADMREARLEAKLVRMLAQHNRSNAKAESSWVKKKSPRMKARVIREIRSYLDESEDDSKEVKEEVGKLVEAIERRKGKAKMLGEEGRISRIPRRGNRGDPVRIDDDEEIRTPPPVKKEPEVGMADPRMLDFVIEMHRHLSAKKVPELRKLCNEEGIEWSRKDVAVGELVKCRAKLAYEEFSESGRISPLFEK